MGFLTKRIWRSIPSLLLETPVLRGTDFHLPFVYLHPEGTFRGSAERELAVPGCLCSS